MHYFIKQFVAHPNVQQLLGTIWYQGLPGFRRRNIVGQLVETSKIAAKFPILSMIYMVAPNSDTGQFIKKPFVKFICHSASYLFFLCTYISEQSLIRLSCSKKGFIQRL